MVWTYGRSLTPPSPQAERAAIETHSGYWAEWDGATHGEGTRVRQADASADAEAGAGVVGNVDGGALWITRDDGKPASRIQPHTVRAPAVAPAWTAPSAAPARGWRLLPQVQHV